jgi:hypothetical protein
MFRETVIDTRTFPTAHVHLILHRFPPRKALRHKAFFRMFRFPGKRMVGGKVGRRHGRTAPKRNYG